MISDRASFVAVDPASPDGDFSAIAVGVGDCRAVRIDDVDLQLVARLNLSAYEVDRLHEAYRRQMRERMDEAFAMVLGAVDVSADRRGLKLLKQWLSPAQLEQYETTGHFDVTGSASGKRYRIKHGQVQNVYELDGFGREICGWCFAPAGKLVAGDVMLAQKLALETNEKGALKVANAFRPAGGVDLRPGAFNYAIQTNPEPGPGWFRSLFDMAVT